MDAVHKYPANAQMYHVLGEETEGISAAEFVRQRAARTIDRQEADDHQQQDEPPGEEVALQIFTNCIHPKRRL